MLASGVVHHAAELDGLLIPSGRRLMELSITEALNFMYATAVSGLDAKGRRKLDRTLAGLEGTWRVVEDDRLPEDLKGQMAPPWWSQDHDPFAETFTIG